MPWAGERKSHCRVCGRKRQPQEIFSARGKCRDCGDRNSIANATQLHNHAGPYFEHWRQRSLAALGVASLDDAPDAR